jgi:hypothetical protein
MKGSNAANFEIKRDVESFVSRFSRFLKTFWEKRKRKERERELKAKRERFIFILIFHRIAQSLKGACT